MKQLRCESAMENWKGRVDSTSDYDAFRWHQWVKEIDPDAEASAYHLGKLNFVFLGFCSEQGVERNKGRLGAAHAPSFLRKQMSNLPCTFTQDVHLYDAGDIVVDDVPLEEAQSFLGETVNKLIAKNLFPIVLGGGHETTFGHFLGQYACYKKSEQDKTHADETGGNVQRGFGIINFDAHFDMRPYKNGAHSGSMFLQMADLMQKEGEIYHYLPIGIQEHSNTVSLFKTAAGLGVRPILAKEIQNHNQEEIRDRTDQFLDETTDCYITVCTDVFSSAFAPGVSATQTLGLDPEVVLPMIKHMLKTRKVRGFDICEICPRFDQDNTTSNLGAVILFTVVNSLSKMRHLHA